MAAETWPVGLNECWLKGGFSYQEAANTIMSSVEVGVPKLRRRYTVAYVNVTAGITMSWDELQVFNAFFSTDLQSGVNRFTHHDPVSDTDKEYRFTGTPMISPIGDGFWIAEFQLEMFK